MGRFVNRDPIGYDGSQWNFYEYTASGPVGRLDPHGLEWVKREITFVMIGELECHCGDTTKMTVTQIGVVNASIQFGLPKVLGAELKGQLGGQAGLQIAYQIACELEGEGDRVQVKAIKMAVVWEEEWTYHPPVVIPWPGIGGGEFDPIVIIPGYYSVAYRNYNYRGREIIVSDTGSCDDC